MVVRGVRGEKPSITSSLNLSLSVSPCLWAVTFRGWHSFWPQLQETRRLKVASVKCFPSPTVIRFWQIPSHSGFGEIVSLGSRPFAEEDALNVLQDGYCSLCLARNLSKFFSDHSENFGGDPRGESQESDTPSFGPLDF